ARTSTGGAARLERRPAPGGAATPAQRTGGGSPPPHRAAARKDPRGATPALRRPAQRAGHDRATGGAHRRDPAAVAGHATGRPQLPAAAAGGPRHAIPTMRHTRPGMRRPARKKCHWALPARGEKGCGSRLTGGRLREQVSAPPVEIGVGRVPDSDLRQILGVTVRVVTAEEQLAVASEGHAELGGRVAPVAAVFRAQGSQSLWRREGRGHTILLSSSPTRASGPLLTPSSNTRDRSDVPGYRPGDRGHTSVPDSVPHLPTPVAADRQTSKPARAPVRVTGTAPGPYGR